MVLDIMLPGLSGYRVVSALRAERNWVPVLMLSAKDGEYDEADGLDCGADDYLTKPFSYVVLVARLRALLRRGAPDAAGGAGRRRPDPRPGRRGCTAAASRDRADAAGVLAAGVPDAPRRARSCPRPSILRPRLGRDHDTAIPTSSRCTSATCGARSSRGALETVRGAGYRLRPA